MAQRPNLKLAAIKIGDVLKYDTSVNEIDRIACGTFPFARDSFPSEGITSIRAQRIYEWLMTLFIQPISDSDKRHYLQTFLNGISPAEKIETVHKILRDCGIRLKLKPVLAKQTEFDARRLHPEVIKHARNLLLKDDYFHAVFEAAKAYNLAVKRKSGLSGLDGQALMNKAFSSQDPIIHITPCATETEKNIQDGYRFLAAGLMAAVRNPTAHEPALSFPVDKQDALDILGLISYLFRQLDKATTRAPS